MSDRRALRAVAHRIAAERAAGPGPRPAGARIPLPGPFRADLTDGRTHRIRLTTDVLDVDRFAAALRHTAERHEALRLRPVRDSGRWFLASAEDPVARVADPAELGRADPERPLRWWCAPVGGSVTLVLAVNAYLVDACSWGAVLADVQDAYLGVGPAAPPGPGFGDHCFWLAHRAAPDTDRAGEVVRDLGRPAPQPLWEFTGGSEWATLSRPVPGGGGSRTDAVERLARDGAAALVDCGWRGRAPRTRRGRPGAAPAPLVGRGDEPVLGVPGGPSAPAADVATALDGGWAGPGEPLVQLDVDVLDLPRLHLDSPVHAEPVPVPGPGWQLLLVRRPGDATLHVGGPAPTLPALHGALAPEVADAVPGGDGGGGRPAPAPVPAVPPAMRIVTPQRVLPAEVVAVAVERRASELRVAGLRPGGLLLVETTPGAETPANLLAGLHCRADVLLLDPADPPAWSTGLRARLGGAVTVAADGRVRPPALPASAGAGVPVPGDASRGDGDGALLVGLGSAPGRTVVARVPLDDLLAGAEALAERWRLGAGSSCAGDPGSGEDFAVVVLACGLRGADLVLPGPGGASAVDVIARTPGCLIDGGAVQEWAVPQHQLTGARGWRRAVTGATPGARWWTAEAPATQWWAAAPGDVITATGAARVVDDTGRSMPDGTVGEIAVGVAPGSRYLGDPRRTADRLRPVRGGGRELRTGALAGRCGPGIRVLRFAPDRTVVGNRTCLTDALAALVPDGVVTVASPAEPNPEHAHLTTDRPVAPGVLGQLPRPLAACRPAAGSGGAAPDGGAPREWASPVEELLATEVVEPVLGMPVRRTDQLFSLGATSVQLMRMLLQVNQRYDVEVPLARFFATPTVAVLAELVDRPADPATAVLDVLEHFEGEET